MNCPSEILSDLAKTIIKKKKKNVDDNIDVEENEIDRIVYNLYGLSVIDIKTIESVN